MRLPYIDYGCLTEMIRLLLTMVPHNRELTLREDAAEYTDRDLTGGWSVQPQPLLCGGRPILNFTFHDLRFTHMNLEELKGRIDSGEIDTVIVAAPDVSGKLVGKRFTGRMFIDTVAEHGTHGCNYLLTVDIEMEPQTGFRLANWEKGFGDFELRPDLDTLRILPWQTATALVICDFHHHDGQRVAEAPRSVLRSQLERLAQRGLTCNIASELEFFLFNTTYHDAFASGYRSLPPSSDYRIDYHIMQPAQDEALFRQMRNDMVAAEIPVESSKGEWGRGQHEINFIYNEPLRVADMHSIFKQGVKEIADAARQVR